MISMKKEKTIADSFTEFITVCQIRGLKDKTIDTYRRHFRSISHHLCTSMNIFVLKQSSLDEMVASMRKSGLSANSICSYLRVINAFFAWCREQGLTNVKPIHYLSEETIKETYSDSELKALLKKPNMQTCHFEEYRDWVIINLLMNCGCRAGTIRAIQIRDVDFDDSTIMYRHTKSRKVQRIPLCTEMKLVLREYLKIRGGSETDPLFCTAHGVALTESALSHTIAKYNRRRGVQKTSIHLFRHTFAKKFLLDCNGDAFSLQHILGHTTLTVTKHYCNIYDTDISRNFDNLSPLSKLKQAQKIKMR